MRVRRLTVFWLSRLGWFVVVALIVVLLVHLRAGLVRTPLPGVGITNQPAVGNQGFTVHFSWEQYTRQLQAYVKGLQRGDINLYQVNNSTSPFLPLLRSTWKNSLALFAASTAVGTLLGLLLGLITQMGHRTLHWLVLGFSVFALAVPDFLVTLLGQYASVWTYRHFDLKLWPILADPSVKLGWLLPMIVLSLVPAAYMSRLTVTAFDEIMDQEYIRTARGKGLPEWRVITGHALRNALPRILAGVPAMLNISLCSLLVVERVTNWPGLAQWVVGEEQVMVYPGIVMVYGITAPILSTAGLVLLTWFMLLDGLAQSCVMIANPSGMEERP